MKFTLPLVFVSMAGSCLGVVINFDFNLNNNTDDSNVVADTYVGLAAAPDAAGGSAIWNSIRRNHSEQVASGSSLNTHIGVTSTPTRDSTGLASSVTVNIQGVGIGLINSHIAHQQSIGMQELGASGVYNRLMGDFIGIDSDTGNGTVGTAYGTIAGLAANAYYDIYFYGQGSDYTVPGPSNGASGQNSLFGITNGLGGAVSGSTQQTGWDGVNGGNGVLTEGVEYVRFSVKANSSGLIHFLWQNVVTGPGGNVATDSAPNGRNDGSRIGALNAIQIVSVPEPSTVLLGGLGMLGLLARRRR